MLTSSNDDDVMLAVKTTKGERAVAAVAIVLVHAAALVSAGGRLALVPGGQV